MVEINKGDLFKCLEDVAMITGQVEYYAGKIYKSDMEGSITDESGNVHHLWSKNWMKHFSRYIPQSNNSPKVYRVTRDTSEDGRERVDIGYVVGNPDDIRAYYNDPTKGRVNIEEIITITITPESARDKAALYEERRLLENKLRNINQQLGE